MPTRFAQSIILIPIAWTKFARKRFAMHPHRDAILPTLRFGTIVRALSRFLLWSAMMRGIGC
jgi:hypothetical protein